MRGRWSQWNTSLALLIQPVHFPGQFCRAGGEGGEAGQGGRQVAAEDAEDPHHGLKLHTPNACSPLRLDVTYKIHIQRPKNTELQGSIPHVWGLLTPRSV